MGSYSPPRPEHPKDTTPLPPEGEGRKIDMYHTKRYVMPPVGTEVKLSSVGIPHSPGLTPGGIRTDPAFHLLHWIPVFLTASHKKKQNDFLSRSSKQKAIEALSLMQHNEFLAD